MTRTETIASDAAVFASIPVLAAQIRNEKRRRIAKRILRALRDGTAFPDHYTDLIWGMPQEIGAALHQVEVRLSIERAAIRRYNAGSWYLRNEINPYLVERLAVLRIALRWLRRFEHQAIREAAE